MGTNKQITVSAKNVLKCEKCKVVFKNNDDKTRHMLTHTEEKPFDCKLFGKTYSKRDKMESHLTAHGKSTDNKDTCDETPSLTKEKAADPNKYGTQAQSYYKTRTAKWIPNEMMNPNDLYKFVRKDPRGQKFNCTICSFSHKEIISTRNHVGSAHFPPLLTYHCDQCDKKFATKNEYVKHKSNKHNRVLLVF